MTITTSYPGASAETLARTVAAPIEEQLSGVERLSFFSSIASSNGTVTITATFDVGTNVDQAVFNLNNKVQLALPRLPSVDTPRSDARHDLLGFLAVLLGVSVGGIAAWFGRK